MSICHDAIQSSVESSASRHRALVLWEIVEKWKNEMMTIALEFWTQRLPSLNTALIISQNRRREGFVE